jgi:hypothetical protein
MTRGKEQAVAKSMEHRAKSKSKVLFFMGG